MKHRLALFSTGVILFCVFIIFSYLVHKDLFTHFDFDMTVKLQDNLSRKLDQLFSWYSTFGSFEILSITLALTCSFLLIFRRLKAVTFCITAFFLYGVFHLIELYGKFFVEHLPPPEFMLRTERMVDFPQFHVRSEFSYPSGHSGRTVFLSVILTILVWRSRKLSRALQLLIIAAIAAFDIIMLVSRVYLGEHWTTDVIGGGMLGAAFALISASLLSIDIGSLFKKSRGKSAFRKTK